MPTACPFFARVHCFTTGVSALAEDDRSVVTSQVLRPSCDIDGNSPMSGGAVHAGNALATYVVAIVAPSTFRDERRLKRIPVRIVL